MFSQILNAGILIVMVVFVKKFTFSKRRKLYWHFFVYFDFQTIIRFEEIEKNSKFREKKIGIHKFKIRENM